jgi:hypothetical protein
MKLVVAVLLALAVAAPAVAQQVDIRTTPPARGEGKADITAPGPFHEITEPRENEWYPKGVPVPFDPAFVASEDYETATTRGQYGVAGWSAQNIPVGPAGLQHRERPGWLTFGFAFTWGAAPRAATKPAAATPPSVAPAR